MLTNNYYAILVNSQIGSIDLPLNDKDGNSFFQFTSNAWDILKFGDVPKDNSKIIFGTGTEQPHRGDYKLFGEEITNLQEEKQTSSYELLKNKAQATKMLFMRNLGTEPVTVGEIGWMTKISDSSSLEHTILLDRTILETPITIPAGERAQINYTISWERGS